jgi:hypothetical protein
LPYAIADFILLLHALHSKSVCRGALLSQPGDSTLVCVLLRPQAAMA